MKSLFSLRDNAMLLACWRTRFRPVSLITDLIIFVVIVATILLPIFVMESYSLRNSLSVLELIFYIIQWFILFYGMTLLSGIVVKERRSGTLDLHRVSPQPKLNQAVGLLVGAPCFEWFFAMLLAPVTIILGIMQGVSANEVILSQVSLFLSALVLYALVLLGMLNWDAEKVQGARTDSVSSAITVFVFLVFLCSVGRALSEWLSLYSPVYCTFSPYPLLRMIERFPGFLDESSMSASLQTPIYVGFIMQCIFQLPIFCLFLWAVIRKLRYPDRSLLSKAQAFTAVMILFLIFLTEIALSEDDKRRFMLISFALFVAVIGLFGVYTVTPTRTLFAKYKCLQNAGGTKSPLRFALSDGASSTYWLMGYITLTIATAAVIGLLSTGYVPPRLMFMGMILYALALVQVVFFAGIYESFCLGKYHQKTRLFTILIVLIWLVVPFLSYFIDYYYAVWGGSVFSPLVAPLFFSIKLISLQQDIEVGLSSHMEDQIQWLLIWTFLLNAVAAVYAQVIAARCRRKLQL